MVNFPGRNGRRRRVLNEEVLSASSSHAVLRAFDQDGFYSRRPRYSDAAGVEHHPQITDFVPRRYRTIGLLVLVGARNDGGLALLALLAPVAGRQLGSTEIAASNLLLPEILPAGSKPSRCCWPPSLRLGVFHTPPPHRRHSRTLPNLAGRLGSVPVASANSVASLHQVLARSLGHVTGLDRVRGDAVWWLVMSGLPLAWIVARTLVDVRLECRLAASRWLPPLRCYTAERRLLFRLRSLVSRRKSNPWSPERQFSWPLARAGRSCVLCRFVMLDAQGLIAARPRIARKQNTKASR